MLIFRAQFTDSDGGVASDFVNRLQMLNAHNSKHELSIEKFLMKSEEAFFDKVHSQEIQGHIVLVYFGTA